MLQISRRVEMIHPTIGWRRDERGTHKHAHGSWILWSVARVRSKTMHSLSCITSWSPYITLGYIDSRFFLPLEQSRTALLGCRLAASGLREAARWQLFWYKVLVHWKLKLLNFLVDFVLMLYTVLIIDWVLLLKIFRESYNKYGSKNIPHCFWCNSWSWEKYIETMRGNYPANIPFFGINVASS